MDSSTLWCNCSLILSNSLHRRKAIIAVFPQQWTSHLNCETKVCVYYTTPVMRGKITAELCCCKVVQSEMPLLNHETTHLWEVTCFLPLIQRWPIKKKYFSDTAVKTVVKTAIPHAAKCSIHMAEPLFNANGRGQLNRWARTLHWTE